MASIVIQGDTSGAVTLQAQAAAGTNTINLPTTLGNTGTSAMATTDASGNLGLGVTPSAWASPFKAIEGGDGSTYQSALAFQTNNDTVSLNSNVFYNGSNYVYKYSKAASRFVANKDSFQWFTAASGTAGNTITFTQAMTLDASGNLLVGTTSLVSAERFSVFGSVAGMLSFERNSNASPSGKQITYTAAAPNGTGNQFVLCNDTGATRAEIRSNGGLANYSANNVNLSDRREKINFAPAKSYLDAICAIPVQTFNYIDQNLEEDAGLTLGVVAQDVQAVAPELVMESNWGTEENPKMRLSIYQTDLQYALMKCIQELNAKVEAQAAEIAALKGAK